MKLHSNWILNNAYRTNKITQFAIYLQIMLCSIKLGRISLIEIVSFKNYELVYNVNFKEAELLFSLACSDAGLVVRW